MPAGEIDLFERDEAFVLAGEVGEQCGETVGRQRAHREDEGAAGAVGFFEQRRDEQDRGARGAGGGYAEDMFGSRHGGAAQQRVFIPVCPELVEGPSFCLSTSERTGRPFDKLRTNGEEVWAAMSSIRHFAQREREQISVGFKDLAVDFVIVD